MSKNKAYYEDLFVKHLLEVGVENWCETYERGNYYYCFWLKNGEQRYWTNMSEEHLEEIKENIMENNLKKQDQQIDQLKQQLAEKQNTINEINKEFVQAAHDWKTLCAEKDKEIERLKVFEKAYYFNQTQVSQESMDLLLQNAYQVHNETQLAIQELEKVKEEFGLKSGWSSETDMCFDLEQFIKQQIKELKGK